jgi:small-conductance mechanosensitive channel
MGIVSNLIADLLPYKDLLLVVSLVIVGLVYVYLSRNLSALSRRLNLPEDIVNALRLIVRVFTIAVTAGIIATLFDVPLTLLLGGSTVVGAVIGFGASQTINNVIAGIYVTIARPFLVKDFVRIGDAEGQVEEISINYTKLYTPTFNLLMIPNIQVINSKVLNITHGDLIKYTFSVGFSHDLNKEQLVENCIKPAIVDFVNQNKEVLPREPEYYLDNLDREGCRFAFRLFVSKGEARLIYMLKPQLLGMIMKRWGSVRAESQK